MSVIKVSGASILTCNGRDCTATVGNGMRYPDAYSVRQEAAENLGWQVWIGPMPWRDLCDKHRERGDEQ